SEPRRECEGDRESAREGGSPQGPTVVLSGWSLVLVATRAEANPARIPVTATAISVGDAVRVPSVQGSTTPAVRTKAPRKDSQRHRAQKPVGNTSAAIQRAFSTGCGQPVGICE